MSQLLLQLGRIGDILSLLPLAYASRSDPISIMVSKQYAPLFDGVSYCHCVPFDGEPFELDRAYAAAKAINQDVRCTQVIGPPELVKRLSFEPAGEPAHARTDCFQRESWRLAGKLDLWREGLPLIFDRRDAEREQKLVATYLGPSRKTILLALTGISSPFPYTKLLMTLLDLAFARKYQLLDLSHVKVERFYDYLALYERAHCLVAIDSAPLHLAYAVPSLPVIALVNDQPTLWHGACWRPNHVRHIRYGDFPHRAHEVIQAIKEVGKVTQGTSADVVHVWNQYDGQCPESNGWIACPIELGAVGRDSKYSSVRDEKRMPFLKDAIRLACLKAPHPETAILLTLPDVKVSGTTTLQLPCYAHRLVDDKGGLSWHPAVDLFAFTKAWWKEHQKDVPDFILGKDVYWHRAFMEFMKRHGAKDVTGIVTREAKGPLPKTEGETPPRVKWNEAKASALLKEYGEPPLFPKVSEQIETIPLNRRALSPFGYNGSIIEHGEGYLLAYRWHQERTLATRLAIAELDDKFNVTNNSTLQLEGSSTEDPRFFRFQNQLWLSWVCSTWPETPPKCVTRYGLLLGEHWRVENPIQPFVGKIISDREGCQTNDWTGLEKNWCFFESDQKLFCFYDHKSVVQFSTPSVTTTHRTESLKWRYGIPRGGTPPVPYEGKLLRFFHSRLDNEPSQYRRRYYLGACLHEPEPPFKMVAISKEPVVRGSEDDNLSTIERSSCFHRKPKVIFPAGIVTKGYHWIVSVGTNDCMTQLLKVTPKDLKL